VGIVTIQKFNINAWFIFIFEENKVEQITTIPPDNIHIGPIHHSFMYNKNDYE